MREVCLLSVVVLLAAVVPLNASPLASDQPALQQSIVPNALVEQAAPQMSSQLQQQRKVNFLQFFGPPGLSRNNDGKLVMTEKVKPTVCATYRFAGHYKIPLQIAGPIAQSTNSKGSKGPALQDGLKHVPEGEIVVFTDAMDTIFAGPEAEFLSRFEAMEKRLGFSPILVSTERNCWMYPDCAHYAPGTSSFRYVNSGGFVARNNGEFRRFADAWTRCVSAGVDDQECVHYFFMKHPSQDRFLENQPVFKTIVLDTDCEILQAGYATMLTNPDDVLTPKREIDVSWFVNGHYVNPETQTRPIAIHYNSNGERMPAHAQQLLGDNDDWKSHVVSVWGENIALGDLCK